MNFINILQRISFISSLTACRLLARVGELSHFAYINVHKLYTDWPLLKFYGPALDTAWNKCFEERAMAAERLRDLGSQGALVLLRSSFCAPTVLHLFRCAHFVSHEALKIIFDCCLS